VRKLYDDMDEASSRFYSKIFNTAVLNTHAVKRGYFDILLCETDDPKVMQRWRDAVPQVIELIHIERNKKD
jgi:hypothetical protein